MNLQARIDRYKERGFQQVEAEILVLIEESAAALFTAFPEQFILFGGATLVLFYESPRLSRDLDLLASPCLHHDKSCRARIQRCIVLELTICLFNKRPDRAQIRRPVKPNL